VIEAQTPQEIQEKVLLVTGERIPQRFGLDPIADIQAAAPRVAGESGC
jgi:exodeoxyribonuclease V alpha subunit